MNNFERYHKKGGTYEIPTEIFNDLLEENQQLKKEYDKALELLCDYTVPCESDSFMKRNKEYCSKNCRATEGMYKKCWQRYIQQSLDN